MKRLLEATIFGIPCADDLDRRSFNLTFSSFSFSVFNIDFKGLDSTFFSTEMSSLTNEFKDFNSYICSISF